MSGVSKAPQTPNIKPRLKSTDPGKKKQQWPQLCPEGQQKNTF